MGLVWLKTEGAEEVPFLCKTHFLLPFEPCRSNNLDLPMASVRNPDKSQPGPLASKNRGKLLLHVDSWSLCQCLNPISNCIRHLGPAWMVRSLSHPKGKNIRKFTRQTKFLYYRNNRWKYVVLRLWFTHLKKCPCFEETHWEEFKCKRVISLPSYFQKQEFDAIFSEL